MLLIRNNFLGQPTRMNAVVRDNLELTKPLSHSDIVWLERKFLSIQEDNLKSFGWTQQLSYSHECVTSFWEMDELRLTVRAAIRSNGNLLMAITYWDWRTERNVHHIRCTWRTYIRQIILSYTRNYYEQPQLSD